MGRREIAEFHPAFFWICPNCGGEFFERVVVREISPAEAGRLAGGDTAAPPDRGYYALRYPRELTCAECGSHFPAQGSVPGLMS